jgi:hypothetical protein
MTTTSYGKRVKLKGEPGHKTTVVGLDAARDPRGRKKYETSVERFGGKSWCTTQGKNSSRPLPTNKFIQLAEA